MTPLTRPLIVLRRSVQYSSHFHKLVIRLSISIAKDIQAFTHREQSYVTDEFELELMVIKEGVMEERSDQNQHKKCHRITPQFGKLFFQWDSDERCCCF